jgi:outer membrane protein assembly factor BamB
VKRRPPTLVLLAALTGTVPAAQPVAHWPAWRGPLGTGAAPDASPPVTWNEKRNVRWKRAVPGTGHSTPVIWGDRLFLTTAIPAGPPQEAAHDQGHGAHDNVAHLRPMEFAVLAFERHTGEPLWQRTVRKGLPHDTMHTSGSFASNSPVTDGERVYASFGSNGLYALDIQGKPVWERDLGDLEVKHSHGEGSSPALHEGVLVVNWDHEGESFLIALDARTGKERWRTARDEETSWSTPLVVRVGARTQVIVSATRRVRGYDLTTGEPIWECAGLGGNVVASPVAHDGIVYVANSYDIRKMMAIRLADAKGDVTGTDAVVWSRDRDTPYVPSPLLYRDVLYFFKHYQGILTGVEAATGRTVFGPERVPGVSNVYASPVAAAGRLYVAGLEGTTTVLDTAGQVLAQNVLDDAFAASPALAGDALYLRGREHLYCLAGEEKAGEGEREPSYNPGRAGGGA